MGENLQQLTWEQRIAFYDKHYFVEKSGHVGNDGLPCYIHGGQERALNAAMSLLDFTEARSVLSIGCSVGWFIHGVYMVDRNILIRGIDISEYVLSHTVQEIRPFVEVADVSQEIPFSSNSFDLVYAFDVLEHLQDYRAIVTAVDEIYRVCEKYVILRMSMVEYTMPYEGTERAHHDEQRYDFFETLNILPHYARLALIGIHPYLSRIQPKIYDIEHPNEHPREFWIKVFEYKGFREISLPENYYIFPNALNICSFDTLLFMKKDMV